MSILKSAKSSHFTTFYELFVSKYIFDIFARNSHKKHIPTQLITIAELEFAPKHGAHQIQRSYTPTPYKGFLL